MTENTQENNVVNLISNVLIEKIKSRPGCIAYFQWVLEQPEEMFTLIETHNHFESTNTYKLTKEYDRLCFYIKHDEQNITEYRLSVKVISTKTGLALHAHSDFNRTYFSTTPQTELQVAVSGLPLIVQGFDVMMNQLGL